MKSKEKLITIEPINAEDLEGFGFLSKIGMRAIEIIKHPSVDSVFKAFKATFDLVVTGAENIVEVSFGNSVPRVEDVKNEYVSFRTQVTKGGVTKTPILESEKENPDDSESAQKTIVFGSQSNNTISDDQDDPSSDLNTKTSIIKTTPTPKSQAIAKKTIISTRASVIETN
jgi:hypothetical protein